LQTAGQGDVGYISLKLHFVALADELTAWKDRQFLKLKQLKMKLYTEEQVKSMLDRARLHKQDDSEMFSNEYLLSAETPIELPSDEEIEEELKNDISVSSRLKYITEEKDIKVAEFIIDYAFKDEKEVYTNGAILVPLFRVLDAISQKGNQYQEG
jgi:hypothetical protein